MNGFKCVVMAAFAGCLMMAAAPKAAAQVTVEVGVAPACPYGYYGPEWFTGGVFVGTGPWFHGPDNFRGHVNNRFHPEHGYVGPKPNRGDKPEPNNRTDKVSHFKGNEVRDGRGHADGKKR